MQRLLFELALAFSITASWRMKKPYPLWSRCSTQDEHILVADKPHFLPVIPSGKFLHETLLVRLRKQRATEDLVPIHRLDRETAGVVLFSLNPKTRGHYTSLFRNRKVRKVYEALAPTLEDSNFPNTRRSRIVRGEPFFRMKEVPGEANSETTSASSAIWEPHSISVASTHRQETPTSSPPRGLRNSDHQ
jgi:23S rRNA-/tRNA-specific pseudouridylate synthase